MTFENITDGELINLWHKQARELSYYQAAEGESWYKERPMREACSAEFRKINEELRRRNLPTPQGQYLL